MVPSTRTNPIDRMILYISSYFGSHAREVERFIKFFIVGIIGFFVDFTTLNILQNSILVPIEPSQNLKISLATGIAFCAAVLSNFFWNRYWTYPDSRSKSVRRQLVMFYGVNTATLLFRLLFVGLSFKFFGEIGENLLTEVGVIEALDTEDFNQLGTNIAQALAVILGMFWNFTINRLWTYNDVSS